MAERLNPRNREYHEQAADARGEREKWCTLPMELLDRICSFLKKKDQTNMTEAFHTSSRGIVLSSCWRRFDFHLTESMLTSKYCEPTKMAYNFGDLFQNVVIEFPAFQSFQSYTGWMGHFFIFMQQLTESCRLLTGIEFRNLGKRTRHLCEPWYRHICMVIADFFGIHGRLKKVSFYESYFKYSDGIWILREAIRSNNGLVSLQLAQFLELVAFDPHDSADEQILPEILSLPNLRHLKIDHRLILGERANASEVFEALRNHQRRLDIKIILIINAASRNWQHFATDQWNALKAENQNLHVEMAVGFNSTFKDEMELFIVPNAPITNLTCKFNPTLRFNLEELSRRLNDCNSYECLERLFLIFDRKSYVVGSCLFFLPKCKKLSHLSFTLWESLGILEIILQALWLKRMKYESLKQISLHIYLDLEDSTGDALTLLNLYRHCFLRYRAVTLDFQILRP